MRFLARLAALLLVVVEVLAEHQAVPATSELLARILQDLPAAACPPEPSADYFNGVCCDLLGDGTHRQLRYRLLGGVVSEDATSLILVQALPAELFVDLYQAHDAARRHALPEPELLAGRLDVENITLFSEPVVVAWNVRGWARSELVRSSSQRSDVDGPHMLLDVGVHARYPRVLKGQFSSAWKVLKGGYVDVDLPLPVVLVERPCGGSSGISRTVLTVQPCQPNNGFKWKLPTTHAELSPWIQLTTSVALALGGFRVVLALLRVDL